MQSFLRGNKPGSKIKLHINTEITLHIPGKGMVVTITGTNRTNIFAVCPGAENYLSA